MFFKKICIGLYYFRNENLNYCFIKIFIFYMILNLWGNLVMFLYILNGEGMIIGNMKCN